MGFTQATNMTVAAFIQQDLQPGILFTFAQQRSAFGREEAVFGRDAGLELAQQRRVGDAVDLDMVGFVEMSGGVGDGIGPGGIVGEQQQALAGLVESADGRKVGFGRTLQTGEDRGAAFFI
jgi:hypothetical protein